jgi:hypothetical protein
LHHKPPSDPKSIEKEHYIQAVQLVKGKQPQAAWGIIANYANKFSTSKNDPSSIDWLPLAIETLEMMPEGPSSLGLLYQRFPQAFENKENASLIIAGVLISEKNMPAYKKLRDAWKERSANPEAWFVLEADALLVENRNAEAIAHLNSQTFEGAADTGRLVRLALLSAKSNLQRAWELLAEAQVKDPKNPLIRSFRGQILEVIGQYPLARAEYGAAIQLAPGSPQFINQLAEFYRRHGNYSLALKTWETGLNLPGSDYLWLETIFWSRVFHPVDFNWKTHVPPEGSLKPLLDYLITLNPGVFWDASTYQNVPQGAEFIQKRQETFWLRLLQLLADGKETEAMNLLEVNPFNESSWSPTLEKTIRQVLAFRQTGEFLPGITLESASDDKVSTQDTRHPFFVQLSALSMNQDKEKNIPQNLQQLLKGKDAFAAIFLAGGWLEAALQLKRTKYFPEGTPDWVVVGFAEAIRYNRGIEDGLSFARKQIPIPSIVLLIAEWEISIGETEKGTAKLVKFLDENSDRGIKAAWILSINELNNKNYSKAKEYIAAQPKLAQSTLGKELLAKIAFAEGNKELAEQLYLEIENDSDAAKLFLGEKAIEEQNWKKARENIEYLLRQHPENEQLQKDMQKIQK